jgi:hypothetical protein
MNTTSKYINLELQLLIEAINFDNLESIGQNLKDTKWSPPLSTDASHYKFEFNIDEDPCGSQTVPCYSVTMGKSGNGWSFAFQRKGTYESASATGGAKLQGTGADNPRIAGILYAYGKFIKEKSPREMRWMPTTTSRSHLYDRWMNSNLFPDRYVKIDEDKWVRRDVYDQEYVPTGYPKVPSDITMDSPARAKKEALKKMQDEARQNQEQIDRLQRERDQLARQQREEEEQRRREEARIENERRLNLALNDRDKNPESLAVDDIVRITPDEYQYFGYSSSYSSRNDGEVGKIQRIDLAENISSNNRNIPPDALLALVLFPDRQNALRNDFTSGSQKAMRLDQLRKETENEKTQRQETYNSIINQALKDPNKNPNSLKLNDEIIVSHKRYSDPDIGQRGKITEFILKNDDTVLAQITWSPESKEYLDNRYGDNAFAAHRSGMILKYLEKATPENIENLRRNVRNYEIEQQISRGRERIGRITLPVSSASFGQQATPLSQEILNHPANPDHVNIGDRIEIKNTRHTYFGRGGARRTNFKGTLINLRDLSNSPNKLYATIRFDNSERNLSFYVVNPRWTSEAGTSGDPYSPQLFRDSSDSRFTQRRQRNQERADILRTNSRGFNIGDNATVISGRNRGKSGKIVDLRVTGQNVIATIMPTEGTGQFTSNVNMLQSPEPRTESIHFKDYVWLWENDYC